jgi:hypothetical protein
MMSTLLLASARTNAGDFSLESVGVRSGFSVGGKSLADFTQSEAFFDVTLPLAWQPESGWRLWTRLNTTVGWLSGNGATGFIGSCGPAIALGHTRIPVSLEGGLSPTLITTYEFGSTSLGDSLQFTTYLGLNLDLTRHLRLGYRFQHMSNAGLSRHNPGLNLNMFALSYVF